MSYTTGKSDGSSFGYPDSYGRAYVTYQGRDIIQLEFRNGAVEDRTYKNGQCTRVLTAPDGSKDVIVD